MFVNRRSFLKLGSAALVTTASAAKAMGMGGKNEVRDFLGPEDEAFVKNRGHSELCTRIIAEEKAKDIAAGKPVGDKKTPAPTELLARVRIRYLQESATPSHVLGATDFGIYILNEPIQKLAVAAYKAEVAAIINTDAPGGKGGRFSGITHGLEKATATIASKAGAEAMMKGGTLANADAKGMLTAQSAARTEAEREAKAVK